MPKRPVADFVSSGPVNAENFVAIQGQRVENIEDSECAGSDSFPLCYSSFELLRYILQISKQKHEFEIMENFMNYLEVEGKQHDQSYNES